MGGLLLRPCKKLFIQKELRLSFFYTTRRESAMADSLRSFQQTKEVVIYELKGAAETFMEVKP